MGWRRDCDAVCMAGDTEWRWWQVAIAIALAIALAIVLAIELAMLGLLLWW
jgi:hypothetical protein